MNITYQKKNLW